MFNTCQASSLAPYAKPDIYTRMKKDRKLYPDEKGGDDQSIINEKLIANNKNVC